MPEPNIAFIGKRAGREPLVLINNGNTVIVLPEKQSKPFYHAEARTIIKLFPELYKAVRPKN